VSNYVSTTVEGDQVFLESKQEVNETLSVSVAGTAASITDTTSYAVSDQDGLAIAINVLHAERTELNLGAQTVTFPSGTTTALHAAAAINDQCKQVNATVTGGQVVVSSDDVGSEVTITATAGTSDLTWDTPVAGTGFWAGATVSRGTLLARTTSGTAPYTSGDIVPYNSGGSPTGADTIRGVADFDATFSASGSLAVKMAIGGKVDKNKLSKISGSAVTQAELDALVANTGITYTDVVDGIDSQL
jgi:hypothetical protein